jgi:putative methyltransferase (TIGR04325 family)
MTPGQRFRQLAVRWLPPIVADAVRSVMRGRWSGDPTEWEYSSSGWPDGDPSIRGWNDQSVVRTQLDRWPAFAASVAGTGPLGLSHEAASPGPTDYGTHNTVMSFAYVLARAAQDRSRISMLDWGGGIGHYYAYGRALLPDVGLDYHCRDLPLLADGGRSIHPDGVFHSTDETALSRSYDLVMASSSLQYAHDWRGTLAKLVAVAGRYVYVTRQPFVAEGPSFVVVQRPSRYGYLTAYPGWFLNRDEFLAEARGLGLGLIREFLIAERPLVPKAPTQADYRGFLFSAPQTRAGE